MNLSLLSTGKLFKRCFPIENNLSELRDHPVDRNPKP